MSTSQGAPRVASDRQKLERQAGSSLEHLRGVGGGGGGGPADTLDSALAFRAERE